MAHMEVPSNQGQRKSVAGFDKKTLVKKGMMVGKGSKVSPAAPESPESTSIDSNPNFTKYQKERRSTDTGGMNQALVHALLDGSSMFRSRTSFPQGLRLGETHSIFHVIRQSLVQILNLIFFKW